MLAETEKSLKISIIIINFNGAKFIENCIDSIKDSDLDGSCYEIIIADNRSSDNSVDLIKRRYPWVRLVEFGENYGFCKGNNLAATYARGSNLFFLNNDTKIGPYTLSRMLSKIESDEGIAICGCRMLNYDGTSTFHCGIGIDILGWPVIKSKLFYIEGSALMIKKDIFNLLGGFDEDYFMFHEDVDLCWRARLMGYKVEVADNTAVYHFMGANAGGGESDNKEEFITTAFRRYYSERNTVNTLLKNYSFISLIFIIPLYLIISFVEISFFCLLRRFNMVKIYLSAHQWNIKNINKTLLKRKKIQRSRKVPDSLIFKNMSKISGKLLVLREFGIPKIK